MVIFTRRAPWSLRDPRPSRRGRNGRVYGAIDRRLNRPVAIKLVAERHRDRPDLHERFKIEIDGDCCAQSSAHLPAFRGCPVGQRHTRLTRTGSQQGCGKPRYLARPLSLPAGWDRSRERQALVGALCDGSMHLFGFVHPGSVHVGRCAPAGKYVPDENVRLISPENY